MDAPLIYIFDSNTGEYTGYKEARKSPLDDEWLLPSPDHQSRTLEAPPQAKDGYTVCRINGEWVHVEDNRGKLAYDKTSGMQVFITDLGEIPDEYTLQAYPGKGYFWINDAWSIPPLTIDDYNQALTEHLDATARKKNYGSALSCASYTSSTNATWKQEADDFIAWRDKCWQYAIDVEAKVKAGTIETPSLDEFINNAPKLNWL